ncbi:NADP-dependent malic enzyme [Olea europaea subsp. europaea]|uniref:NADP-dependent malic enzyme n=1 Tax=Olea europaea subsp. europaea TaxID=158383 RepID=A0A8S0QLI0_OLEEU|nr:NADP-dependent malic enzyme [Olea europaea subsp. europaea]
MTAVKQNYGGKVLVQFEDFAKHNAFELLAKHGTTHLIFNDDIQAGTGIAELIALEMSKQTKDFVEETCKKTWLVDSKGLIVHSRKESRQHFKKPWAQEHEPCNTLLDAVKAIKPTALIGISGVGKTFTKEMVEAMAAFNKVLSLSLSNDVLHGLI